MTLTTASLHDRSDTGVVDEKPDPAARPRRRSFTAEYKARILDEYDSLPVGSELRGALLRREGLYSSHVAEWRKARDAGARKGLAPRGKKPKRTPEQASWRSCVAATSCSKPSWNAPSWRWRSREKRTLMRVIGVKSGVRRAW